MTSVIKMTQDRRFLIDLGNYTEYTFTLGNTDGYRYGLLILGDGANINKFAMYGLCAGILSQDEIRLAPIYKPANAQEINVSISGNVLTITAQTRIYGGVRIIWLG